VAGSFIDRIEVLHGLIRGHRELAAHTLGIASAQYAALLQLTGGVTRTCGEIAGRCGVRHQTMHETLEGLERKGLVERTGPVAPGLARKVWLSRRGSEVVEQCRAALLQLEHFMLARFTAELADTLDQCLEECASQLRKWPHPRSPRLPSRRLARRARPRVSADHEATCPICLLLTSAR
jgi:DNA-binding MarR family transcriptional regulator